MAKTNQNWVELIEQHLEKQKRSTDELGLFYSHGGDKKGAYDSIKTRLKEIQRGERKHITNPLACILTYEFKIPLTVLKPIIEEGFYKALKPRTGIEAVVFPCNVSSKADVKAFFKTVTKYINQAESRIWISEYIPGKGKDMKPEKPAVEGWMKAHKRIYNIIEKRLRTCADLKYKRVLRPPLDQNIDLAKDTIHYGITYCKTITFEHMQKISKELPDQVQLFAVPDKRPMSFMLIDDTYLIREHYQKVFVDDHYAWDLDMLTVECVSNSVELREIFKQFSQELETKTNKNLYLIDLTNPEQLKENTLQFFTDKISSAKNDSAIENFKKHKSWIIERFGNLDNSVKKDSTQNQ